MNLLERAIADNSFLVEDGVSGFGKALTYTPLTGSPVSGFGKVTRVGIDTDPGTGALVVGKKIAVTVVTATFGLLQIGGRFDFTDAAGVAVTAVIPKDGIMDDRTLGRQTVLCKVTSVG